jgi:hypothetical protein
MDNRINENRKKIRLLRAKMLEAEVAIRGQIGRDEDCTETSLALMAMRAEMSGLAKERARLGDDKETILVERLMNPRRALVVRSGAVKPAAAKSAVRPVKRHLVPKRAR